MSGPPPARLTGFLDAMREDGTIVGWAADAQDKARRPVIRLLRGSDVLAECLADVERDDGKPGFRLRPPVILAPADLLEGRVRVRALLPERDLATTLAMTRRMRDALETATGWQSALGATQPAPAPPVADAAPAAILPPPLAASLALAQAALRGKLPVLHLLLPRRTSVVGGLPRPGLRALEEAAAAHPSLAAGWVPLRQAFGRLPNPAALWRQDGRRLSVEGAHATLRTLLAVLRLVRPEDQQALARASALLERADIAMLPRNAIPAEDGIAAGTSFLGVALGETAPAIPPDLFADRPTPRPLAEPLPGLTSWSTAGAPLPWRVVVMAEPGLGGSGRPDALGWWLRHLVGECILSEALGTAAPEAAMAAQPDLLLTLAAEP